MPILNTPPVFTPAIYNEKPVHLRGIPLEFVVKPVARQNGVFVDYPKGFKQPACFVECCEPEVPVDPELPLDPPAEA
jgi:hypothetical protein